jgi:predicted transport protein
VQPNCSHKAFNSLFGASAAPHPFRNVRDFFNLCGAGDGDRTRDVQLGKTDEAHIIRTIEYWDIERKRYPQYEHAAVIVAEEITGRFLNVISLFNGAIPLIAIQLNAFRLGDQVFLVFTKVLDEVQLGLVDEDEEVQAVTDRSYWEERGTKETIAITDELFGIIKQLDPDLELKYNKYYIALTKNDHPNNFVVFRPKKEWVRLELRLPRSEELQRRLEDAGVDVMDYATRWGKYRIRLGRGDLSKNRDLLTELLSRLMPNRKLTQARRRHAVKLYFRVACVGVHERLVLSRSWLKA